MSSPSHPFVPEAIDLLRSRIVQFALFRAELKSLADFGKLTEDFLASEATRVPFDPNSKIPNVGDDDFDAWVESYERRATLEATFPDILRCSLLVSLIALLEGLLFRLCESERAHQGYKVEVGDLRGFGIMRARVFLEKVAGLSFAPDSSFWPRVLGMAQLRNNIVHTARTVKTAEALKGTFGSVPGVSINERGEIYLDAAFLGSAIETIEGFVNELEQSFGFARTGNLWTQQPDE